MENGKLKSQIEVIAEGQVRRLTDTEITFIIRSFPNAVKYVVHKVSE